MKFVTLALIAVASAADSTSTTPTTGDTPSNPGRQRTVGQTCVKTEDFCTPSEVRGENCCNVMTTVFTALKQTVCVDPTKKMVEIEPGQSFGWTCNPIQNGALHRGVSAVLAAASALYLTY